MKDYIIVSKNFSSYFIVDGVEDESDLINFRETIKTEAVKIHKKHKDILDAYLLDNSVEIEQCSNGDWYEININPYYDAFIRFYDENNEYRLKQSFEEKLINEVIGNGAETIKAPNSNIEFLKPNYYIKLKKETSSGILAEIQLDDKDMDCVKFDINGVLIASLDGYCYDKDINLIPYKQKKEWYEDESNFPCLMYSPKFKDFMSCKDMETYLRWNGGDGGYRLATSQEIDQLKVKQ